MAGDVATEAYKGGRARGTRICHGLYTFWILTKQYQAVVLAEKSGV